jgi:anti-anti-sigma factor
MEQFHVQTAHSDGQVVVQIGGDVDLACIGALAEALGQALAPGIPVVVDCSKITFMDSSGLQAFVRARTAADRRGTAFRLTRVSKSVSRVLELSGTTSLFPIAPDSVETGEPA